MDALAATRQNSWSRVADDKTNSDVPLVERWLAEQQQWQRTFMTYMDSMVKNEDFLVHLGNAMRGSLLAGKPYPSQPPPSAAAPETPGEDKLDQVLFALRQLEGQVHDLRLTLDELKAENELRAEKKRGAKKAVPPRPKEPQ
jgi:hypothetical protein